MIDSRIDSNSGKWVVFKGFQRYIKMENVFKVPSAQVFVSANKNSQLRLVKCSCGEIFELEKSNPEKVCNLCKKNLIRNTMGHLRLTHA